jgi:hypothetical protein
MYKKPIFLVKTNSLCAFKLQYTFSIQFLPALPPGYKRNPHYLAATGIVFCVHSITPFSHG